MGEIGISRHEFLYEITYWEVLRIIKGYRRRDWIRNQLMAECTYAAMYAMRDPKGKTVKDLFPFFFEDNEDREPAEPMTEEDYAYEQKLMDEYNFGQALEKPEIDVKIKVEQQAEPAK